LNTGTDSRVVTAMTMLKRHLFNYQGHVGAALVLGGFDHTGPHLYTIYPHGSTDKLPFVTMGSGSLAAMSVFESGYKDGMSEQEGIDLVAEAILAGVFNDLGSGSNVDVCVIKKSGINMMRNFKMPNQVEPYRENLRLPATYGKWPKGTTDVVKEEVYTLGGSDGDFEMVG